MPVQSQDDDTLDVDAETPDPDSVAAQIGSTASRVAEKMQRRSITIAVAESCTAGELAEALAGGGQGSRWLRAGLVSYQDVVKRDLLGVTAPSVVTPQAAAEMATGAARLFGTEVAAATTGVLGDEPIDGVEPTTVVIATLVNGDVRVTEHRFDDDPSVASDQAVEEALGQILEHVTDRIPIPGHDSRRDDSSPDVNGAPDMLEPGIGSLSVQGE